LCPQPRSAPADRREHTRRPLIPTHSDDWDELTDGVAEQLSPETQRRFADCIARLGEYGVAERIAAVRLASDDERALLFRSGCINPDTSLPTLLGLQMFGCCFELLGLA
jgi:hypothetical protein